MSYCRGCCPESNEKSEMSPAGHHRLACGLDLAKDRHAFHVLGPAGRDLDAGMVENSLPGLEGLIERVEELSGGRGRETVTFFMEGTGHLWMVTTSYLERQGYRCKLVKNESVGHQRHLSGQPGQRSDPRDAAEIARLGADRYFIETTLQKREPWITLRYTAREHQLVVDRMTAEKNRLHAFLETGFPRYYRIFADPFRKNSLAVLSVLPAAFRRETAEQFVGAVRERYEGRRLLRKRAAEVFDYARSEALWGYVEAREALARRIQSAARRLRLTTDQKERNASALLSAYGEAPCRPYIESIEGSSSVPNAVTLGLLGQPASFEDSAQVTRMAGLDVGQSSSGRYQGQTRITKAGRAELRRAAVGAARNLSRGANAALTRKLQALQSRKDNPLKYTQALCACAAKYLRTLWYLSVHRETYDPHTALHGKGPAAAKTRR